MSRTAEISAGLLVFRRVNELEVLLGHPGGPFWAKKDDGAWTHPQRPGRARDDDLLATARREFTEETNLAHRRHGDLIALAPVKQRSGKTVHAFAIEADLDLTRFASNAFEIEWPPKSGRRQKLSGNRPHRLFHAAGRDDQDRRLSTAAAARA